MFRNLLSTTATRLIIALINLSIVWVVARYLGAGVLGTVSLITLGVSIIQLFTAILAGSSLVYQTSRKPVTELLITAWIWIPAIALPVWGLLFLFNLIPAGFITDVLWLSALGSLVTIHQNVFLGKERINLFNGLAILQSLVMLGALMMSVFYFRMHDAHAYVTAQYISLAVCTAIGLMAMLPYFTGFTLPSRNTITEAFRFGGFLQAASIMQLFNYRLSYYLIEKFFDRPTLGVFSLGVQIAESVWIISRSMAVLLYSRLSNNRDEAYSTRLTVKFIKGSFLVSVALIVVIVLLPASFFTFIFRSEFSQITYVVAALAPGIVAVAVSLMFSHYFSGTGKPQHNTISSGIGLLFTVALGLTLIPAYGLTGAAITSSVSYLAGTLYQLFIFRKYTGVAWKSFLPKSADFSSF